METADVIFLPGFMCDHRLFTAQHLALSDAGYRCQTGDLSVGISMQRIAEEILRTAPKRFALIGLSMGGLLALELYRLAAHRITHIALLNTTSRADAAGDARKRQLQRVAAGQLDLVLREELKPQYLYPDNRTPERLNLLAGMGSGLGKHTFCNQTIALAGRSSYLDILPSIKCPVLVLAGADDTVCPVDHHEEIAALVPGSDLLILSKCGHLSTLEQSEHVNSALLTLLSKPAARVTKSGNTNLRLV